MINTIDGHIICWLEPTSQFPSNNLDIAQDCSLFGSNNKPCGHTEQLYGEKLECCLSKICNLCLIEIRLVADRS